ncbi:MULTISPECIES: hypothetical protein [Pseudomonas]|uniref:hypothetical protein n=1 Tax=Pseudomonas TaxID=286 RepID=UPI000AB4AFD8|nr:MULTISPECIES: hypothetical protein [Pseudomonas]
MDNEENLGVVVAVVIGVMFVAAVVALVLLVKDKSTVRAAMNLESGQAEIAVTVEQS